MITDAQDANYSFSNATLASQPYVEDKDPISQQLNSARINQQMMLPASVQSRILADIISSTTPSNSTQPTTGKPVSIVNGESASFLFTVADTQSRAIIAIPEPAIYINTVSPENLWPNADYNMATLPVTIFNDPTLSNGNNVVTRVSIGNVSGNDVTVVATCSWRIITQPNTVFTTASVTSSVAATTA